MLWEIRGPFRPRESPSATLQHSCLPFMPHSPQKSLQSWVSDASPTRCSGLQVPLPSPHPRTQVWGRAPARRPHPAWKACGLRSPSQGAEAECPWAPALSSLGSQAQSCSWTSRLRVHGQRCPLWVVGSESVKHNKCILAHRWQEDGASGRENTAGPCPAPGKPTDHPPVTSGSCSPRPVGLLGPPLLSELSPPHPPTMLPSF